MIEHPRVTGSVTFPEPVAAQDGTVRVRVEDVSRADAASRVVSEVAMTLDHPLAVGEPLPFSLEVPVEDERQRLNVRVHLDRSGDGTIAEGDMLSTRSYPVLTQGAPTRVEVVVQTV